LSSQRSPYAETLKQFGQVVKMRKGEKKNKQETLNVSSLRHILCGMEQGSGEHSWKEM
jgi:hypothetical protein